jgi:hypothetical protein
MDLCGGPDSELDDGLDLCDCCGEEGGGVTERVSSTCILEGGMFCWWITNKYRSMFLCICDSVVAF